MHNIDKIYFINSLKSCIELFKKTKIGMKFFIIVFFIFMNYISLVGLGLGGLHFITVILTNLFLIYGTGSLYLLVKIHNKYREKYNKDDIIKNAGETHSILVEGVSSTTSEVETKSSYVNDPDYNKEFAKWQLNFTIYELGILVPLFLSAIYLN